MDLQELKERQSWPLQKKIDHSLYTIETYLARTEGMAYVAFSGGKDSTVLLDLVRVIDKSVPAIFVNTGNEYPDIIKFVRRLRNDKGYNIIEIRPKMTPRQVWEKYGFPLVSKAQAEYIDRFKKNPEYAARQQAKAAKQGWSFGKVSDRWKFLVSEPYGVSNKCCSILKKAPSKKYALETGRHPIIGTMASESDLRRTEYISRGGCNTFGEKLRDGFRSTPLAIWMEEDIWAYIKMRNLEICNVYYRGCERTGCVGCGFGCYAKEDRRFNILYALYPKYYQMIMNYQNNGHFYREAVRKVLAVTGKELPDESGELFPCEIYDRI